MVRILLNDGTRSMADSFDMATNSLINARELTSGTAGSVSPRIDLQSPTSNQITYVTTSSGVHVFNNPISVGGEIKLNSSRADSGTVTGDLWRSSTTTDELKYNDGAVVQLS